MSQTIKAAVNWISVLKHRVYEKWVRDTADTVDVTVKQRLSIPSYKYVVQIMTNKWELVAITLPKPKHFVGIIAILKCLKIFWTIQMILIIIIITLRTILRDAEPYGMPHWAQKLSLVQKNPICEIFQATLIDFGLSGQTPNGHMLQCQLQ
ncbi:hypothetical protein GQX74_009456 [Glossina fuscipes]|nr:hypothetical protein GQX74_009456 [Glossina fuscipes]